MKLPSRQCLALRLPGTNLTTDWKSPCKIISSSYWSYENTDVMHGAAISREAAEVLIVREGR